MAPSAAAPDTKPEAKLIRLVNPATGVVFDYCGRWLRPGKASLGDVKRGWARFPGDRVWLSLPVGVQIQLDSGRLQVLGEFEARESIRDSQSLDAAMPRGNASHSQWLEFAVARGMDRQEAEGLTRDQIRARFSGPVFDPDAPPDVSADGKYEVLS